MWFSSYTVENTRNEANSVCWLVKNCAFLFLGAYKKVKNSLAISVQQENPLPNRELFVRGRGTTIAIFCNINGSSWVFLT